MKRIVGEVITQFESYIVPSSFRFVGVLSMMGGEN